MPIQVVWGESPIIIALPQSGQHIPHLIRTRMAEDLSLGDPANGCLHNVLRSTGDTLSLVAAQFHPCICDADAPDPAQSDIARPDRIGVVPCLTQDRRPLWQAPPTQSEAMQWRALFYAPFHAALRAQIARVRVLYGYAVLIRFRALHGADAGAVVDIATSVQDRITDAIAEDLQSGIDTGGHFATRLRSGSATGWITREYARPERQIFAVQIDIGADLFMTGAHWCDRILPDRAEHLSDALSCGFTKVQSRFRAAPAALGGYRG